LTPSRVFSNVHGFNPTETVQRAIHRRQLSPSQEARDGLLAGSIWQCSTLNDSLYFRPSDRASDCSQCALTSSGSRSPPRNHRSLASYDLEDCAVHRLQEVSRDIREERSHSWRAIELYDCNLRRIDHLNDILSGIQKEELSSDRHGKSVLPLLLLPFIFELPVEASLKA
jgi:hypothetical protein